MQGITAPRKQLLGGSAHGWVAVAFFLGGIVTFQDLPLGMDHDVVARWGQRGGGFDM